MSVVGMKDGFFCAMQSHHCIRDGWRKSVFLWFRRWLRRIFFALCVVLTFLYFGVFISPLLADVYKGSVHWSALVVVGAIFSWALLAFVSFGLALITTSKIVSMMRSVIWFFCIDSYTTYGLLD